jgi:hypothetical protein
MTKDTEVLSHAKAPVCDLVQGLSQNQKDVLRVAKSLLTCVRC